MKKYFQFILIIIILLRSNFSFAQSWFQLTDFPGTERDDGVAFVIGSTSYCLTGLEVGWQCTANGYAFDAVSETWSPMASLPAGNERQYATAFSYNGYGYVLGGVNCSNICLNDFWKYDPANNSWSQMINFPAVARNGMSSFILNNKVYIVGGRLSNGTVLNDVWEYDFVSAQWTQKSNLPFAGIWRGSAFVLYNKAYVAYGMIDTQSFNHSYFSYDEQNDVWNKIDNVNTEDLKYVGTAVCNNKACFYSGLDSMNTIFNYFIVFDPLDSSQTYTSGIPTFGRKGGMAFSINDVFYFTTGVTLTARIKETWKNTSMVSLNEINKKDLISVYPNPSAEILNIKTAASSFSEIEIYNSTGQKIKSVSYSGKLNITDLKNGFYFLKFRDDENNYIIKKFVKQ